MHGPRFHPYYNDGGMGEEKEERGKEGDGGEKERKEEKEERGGEKGEGRRNPSTQLVHLGDLSKELTENRLKKMLEILHVRFGKGVT